MSVLFQRGIARAQKELRVWGARYRKPMLTTEYGTDTASGLHSIRDLPWSEEYQIKLNDTCYRMFDRLAAMTGEQVWNFADFQTSSGAFRVDGNKKGIFTRDRKPKGVADVLRKRWTGIGARENEKPTGEQKPNL